MMYHPKPVGNEQLGPLHLRKYLAEVSAKELVCMIDDTQCMHPEICDDILVSSVLKKCFCSFAAKANGRIYNKSSDLNQKIHDMRSKVTI